MDKKFPEWVRKKIVITPEYEETRRILRDSGLNTVCEHARCPNVCECYGRKYATFMILGSVCTRNCAFCSVEKGKPVPPDPAEPEKIAGAVRKLGLRYVVLTSVTRDDLPDGGAGHFAACIRAIHESSPGSKVEVLIPDFMGDRASLRVVLSSNPDVLAHNLETVPSLYSAIRPGADYHASLRVLEWSKQDGFLTKSGIMAGLGETHEEVLQVMRDLRSAGCDFFVIGQYLQPSKSNFPVKEFIRPEVFEAYRKTGEEMGFKKVFAGTFCRSSYMAEEALL